MKKKVLLIHFTLVIAILFSILFQSFDSYAHFKKETAESKCVHESTSKHEITHQHHLVEHCFVCKFSFSAAVHSAFLVLKNQNQPAEHQNKFYYYEVFKTFPGNSNLLRGPPIFNV
jgi:hypothetical protein